MGKINLFERVTGMRLRYRMFLVYILGGALPMILIGFFLIRGITQILLEQVERGELTELAILRSQAEEMFSTMGTVTNFFYFDPKLEEIAEKQYGNYQEVVDDYKAYTGFWDYTRYYNNIVGWVNIYIENSTLVENSRFGKVTEKIREEEWYNSAKLRNGSALWRYRPIPADGRKTLTMLRMLKTAKGGNVGVLCIYIRPERFELLMQEKNSDTLILLNGETVFCKMENAGEEINIASFLPIGESEHIQKNILIGKENYLVTCETIRLPESEDYLQIVSLRCYADILAQVKRQNAKSIISFAISAILSISIILVFSHSFSRRVEHFRTQMHRAAEGNFELEEIGGNDEIASLYNYLGTMIGEIKRLLSEIYREKLHASRLTIQQKEAEFKMLASQINPHFLYNTLETIRMRARKSGQTDIEEIVKMLAKIMRSYIQTSSADAPLKTELSLVEYYLKIQQYRFGERICYRIEMEEVLAEYRILPLLIQPLVENSIIHGLECKEGAGLIQISAGLQKESMVISVEDNGMGISATKLENIRQKLNRYEGNSKHIGLANVHQRIRLRYGAEYGVTITSEEGKYTRVEIILPKLLEDMERGGESVNV